mmetsp:Transcript_36439/g.109836  ORF Transcript_36439/g.109836 Transcript_36439/m.109836 type:complete len:427 (-) Transcript_36439:68-1348(-)
MPRAVACGAVGATVAVLLACAWQLIPLARRLWRLPRVLVPPHEKAADAVRIGLLGASFIGQVAVVHASDKRRDVVVVAVAARNKARAAAYADKHRIPSHHGGEGAYDSLLQRPDIDAVYISLPTRLHFRWASAALAAGKHVLLEKPLAANAAEAEALQQVAAQTGRILMEAAHYRYHPAPRRARELLLEAGGLGKLETLDAHFSMLDPKAWFNRILASPAPPASSPDRLQERLKNLDRWWYCVDSLLWASDAVSAKVESAAEDRYSLSARLTLTLRSPQPTDEGSAEAVKAHGELYNVNATVEMARDRLLPAFDWSLATHGSGGAALRLANLGFPFLWHALDLEARGGPGGIPPGEHRREQHYGAGETTFEHQLGAFAAAIRGSSAPSSPAQREEASRSSLATARVVDEILTVAGTGPLPSEHPVS